MRAFKTPLGVVALASLVYVAIVAMVSFARLRFPYDVEWMEGGVLTQAARIARGESPYPPPSATFVAFLYPPLYPTLVALLGAISGGISYAVARGLSLTATVVSAALCAREVQLATKRIELTVLTVGLEAALVPFAGSFHDLARPDATAIAFVAVAAALAARGDGKRLVLSGVLLAAACFTKQTSLLLGSSVIVGVAWTRSRRDAVVVAGTALFCGAAAFALLESRTGGWLSFFLIKGHQSHRFYRDNLGFFFFRDAFHLAPLLFVVPIVWLRRFLPASPLAMLLAGHLAVTVVQRAIATRDLPHMYFRDLWYPHVTWAIPPLVVAALVFFGARRASEVDAEAPSTPAMPLRYWGAIFLGALVASATGHATQWAYKNSLMPLGVLGVPFVVLAIDALTKGDDAGAMRARRFVAVAIGAQLIAWWQPPSHDAPTAQDAAAWRALAARIERVPGKVMVLGHPRFAWEVGAVEHLHGMGISDLAALGGVPDLGQRLAQREWAAIVIDVDDDMGAPPIVTQHYRPVEWLGGPNMKTGTRCRPGQLWVPR